MKKKYSKLDKSIFKGYLESHGRPLNRRQFLASGAMPFAASLALPSVLQVLNSFGLTQAGVSYAAEVACSGAMSPFVSVNLAGGAAMTGNVVPLDKGNNLLGSYDELGYGSGPLDPTRVVRPFGPSGAAFNSTSQFLAGIVATASPEAVAKTAALSFMVQSMDDSSNNEFEMNGLLNGSGLIGSVLPDLGQNRNQPAIKTGPAALNVQNISDIVGAVGVTGSLDNLTQTQKGRLFKTINRLSASQTAKLAASSAGGQILGDLVTDATGGNVPLIEASNSGLDPNNDAAVSGIWNLGNNGNETFAAVVYNALKGTSGTASINMGGYDYHGQNNRVTQDARDLQAGNVLGRVIESAHVMGKPVTIALTSDGAVDSSKGSPNFSGDSGNRGAAIMFFYHPTRKPTVTGPQVGNYTPGQVVDTDFVTGGSAKLTTAAMFANYMAFNGVLGKTESVTGRLDEINKNYSVLVKVANEKIPG